MRYLSNCLMWGVTVFGLTIVLPVCQSEAQSAGWEAGKPVPLASQIGPLGATHDYEVTPMCTADLYGHGPYDLILRDARILPFKSFDDHGVPVYGQPVRQKLLPGQWVPLVDRGKLEAIVLTSKEWQLWQFEPERHEFELKQSWQVSVPRRANIKAAISWGQNRIAVLFTKGDGLSRGVPGAGSHSADYQPFDGAGIWRGTLSYENLGAVVMEQGKTSCEVTFPLSADARDFLIRCTGMTAVQFPGFKQRGVVGAASQGMFYYFPVQEHAAGLLQEKVFVGNRRGNGMRHPGMFPAPVLLPHPETGDSDLLVGDTGTLWFYRFSGTFTAHGGPIYDAGVPALIESPQLSLGALPVITSGDLDGDGLIDLVAGNDAGHLFYIRNRGDRGTMLLDPPLRLQSDGEIFKVDGGYSGVQGPPESRWGYTCPSVCDWNGDGLADLVYNSILGQISVLLQRPQTSPPAFEKPYVLRSDTMELQLVWRTQPAVTTWGQAEGRRCLVVNDEHNQLRCYWQVDAENVTPGELLRMTTGEPIQAHGQRFGGQFGRTKLQIVDWDGDGQLDLLLGTGRAASIPGPGGIPDETFTGDRRQASVLLMRNAGTNAAPVFEYPQVMCSQGTKLEMGVHSCSPLAIDTGYHASSPADSARSVQSRSDGSRKQLDLLVGHEDGGVYYFPGSTLSTQNAR